MCSSLARQLRRKSCQRSLLEGVQQRFPWQGILLPRFFELDEVHVMPVTRIPVVGKDSRRGSSCDPVRVVVLAHGYFRLVNGCRFLHMDHEGGEVLLRINPGGGELAPG